MRLDELDAFDVRIAERRHYAQHIATEKVREAMNADTDMLADLVGRCRTLILANNGLHELVDDLRRALAARPTVTVEAPRKTRTRQPPEQQSEPTPTSDEVGAILLASAKDDAPPPGAKERALAATLGTSVSPLPAEEPKETGVSPHGVVKRWICARCASDRLTCDGELPYGWRPVGPSAIPVCDRCLPGQDASGAPGTTSDPSEPP